MVMFSRASTVKSPAKPIGIVTTFKTHYLRRVPEHYLALSRRVNFLGEELFDGNESGKRARAGQNV